MEVKIEITKPNEILAERISKGPCQDRKCDDEFSVRMPKNRLLNLYLDSCLFFPLLMLNASGNQVRFLQEQSFKQPCFIVSAT